MNKIINSISALISLLLITGCSDLIDKKSDLKLSTPVSVQDNQALLDMYGYSNTEFTSSGETSADDYYMTDADYNSLYYEANKRLYTWMPDYVSMSSSYGNDWASTYRAIYTSNAVLYNLEHYNLSGVIADNVRGQALALRAIRYLDAAQIWCLVYNNSTADTDLGLPLRLDPDINIPSVRSTVRQTYEQIIDDLITAIPLLPVKQVSKIRISKTAAYAYLARTYLLMGDFENALIYASQSFDNQNGLMDFNGLDTDQEYTIPDFNEEITFWAAMRYEYHLIPAKIPQNIYDLYDDNDLRKKVFFNKSADGQILFKGYYNNANGPSAAVAVDELYLISAECHAYLNHISDAMDKLNQLLLKRWKAGTFIKITATNKEEALGIIRTERRKELLLRGLRWPDLKRYNRDGINITLNRKVNGQTFTLVPNDLRYAIAIPEEIIQIAGIPQNAR